MFAHHRVSPRESVVLTISDACKQISIDVETACKTPVRAAHLWIELAMFGVLWSNTPIPPVVLPVPLQVVRRRGPFIARFRTCGPNLRPGRVADLAAVKRSKIVNPALCHFRLGVLPAGTAMLPYQVRDVLGTPHVAVNSVGAIDLDAPATDRITVMMTRCLGHGTVLTACLPTNEVETRDWGRHTHTHTHNHARALLTSWLM